ncbi:MAG TPA: amino acid adenylation domain-containing protein, partial [Puia sp.]|nr:amino acid adenylation domain-containing protein [Puia sp.]
MLVKYLPLHPAQQDVFLDQMLNSDSAYYNIGGYIRLQGVLDVDILKVVFQSVPEVFDAFNMRFGFDEHGVPTARMVRSHELYFFEELDFSTSGDPAGQALQWMQRQFNIPFVITEGAPLFELVLLKISANEYWSFNKYHHLITDGFGFTIWAKYIAGKYRSLVEPAEMKWDYPSYVDEMARAFEYRHSDSYAKEGDYWRQKIGPKPVRSVSPRVSPQSGGQTSGRYVAVLDNEREAFLYRLQEQSKCSLQQLTIAALGIYFSRLSGQEEVVFGTLVHKRRNKRNRSVVGMFSGIIPFKAMYSSGLKVEELLRSIVTGQKSDYRNQEYLIGDLNKYVKNDLLNGFLDIIVNYKLLDFALDFGKKIEATTHELSCDSSRFPLHICWRDYGKQQPLELYIEYQHDYFSDAEANDLIQRLFLILEQFYDFPRCLIGDLCLVAEDERRKLDAFNATGVFWPRRGTVVDQFEEQAGRTPGALAVVYEGLSLSYGELDARSNRLAQYLRGQGVDRNVLVPLCVDRSLEMIVGILGILKAGGAYVPLDPSYPVDRLRYMLEDTSAALLVSSSRQGELLKQLQGEAGAIRQVLIDEWWEEMGQEAAVRPAGGSGAEDACYVIYTSGSTGRPKGVVVEHGGVSNMVFGHRELLGVGKGEKVLQFASMSFDGSCQEIFNTLCNGGSLVLIDQERMLSPLGLSEVLRGEGVAVATLPPSYQGAVKDELAGLRVLYSAGEELDARVASAIGSKGIRLINGYGPTENTVTATLTDRPVRPDGIVTIGRPIGNVQIYILSGLGKVQPVGVSGELCIGGVQVARGYLNQPELTSERFISHGEWGRVYRSGDRGRWLGDGNIEYQGRMDEQVKLRGYRIEPGE